MRLRLRGEGGIALPVAMGVLSVTLIIAATAASVSGGANESATKDRRVKRAIQAADAGLQAAIYRMNKFDVINIASGSPQCPQTQANGTVTLVAAAADGWCPESTEQLGTDASYSYRIATDDRSSGDSVRTIVATGTVGGVTRRVAVRAYAGVGDPLFGNWAVRSDATFTLDSNSSVGSQAVAGNVQTNGDIILRSNSQICGNATPGPGESVQLEGNASVCNGYSTTPATGRFVLPPVDQGTARTENDNHRIKVEDTCSSCNSVQWNAAERTLVLNSNSTLTLTGNVYSFCKLHLNSNSQLIIGNRPLENGELTAVRIYIDHPEDCPGVTWSPAGRMVNFDSNTRIVNLNGNDPRTLQFYLMGSRANPRTATSMQLDSNTSNHTIAMAVYAPFSDVALRSNANFLGAIAAQSLSMDSNSHIQYSATLANLQSGVTTRYGNDSYRECVSTLPSGQPAGYGC